jgi:DNA-entry nuclease
MNVKKRLFVRAFTLFLLLSMVSGLLSCTASPICKPDTQEIAVAALSDRTKFLSELPPFDSSPFVTVNGNEPFFTKAEITAKAFETYAPLDHLNRCGTTLACIGREIMPTEERGAIGQVKPSGWQTAKYDSVDGKYLYNRCHLIGFQLTGENANERNLVTGTRYLNVEGMLPFENMVADYVKESGNHVMYRVTPVFKENELVCRGVLMEAFSVEDGGDGIRFCVWCYNVQPGVEIDYADGSSRLRPTKTDPNETAEAYVLNTNSKKIHLPDCKNAKSISEKNRKEVRETLSSLQAKGYTTGGCCL